MNYLFLLVGGALSVYLSVKYGTPSNDAPMNPEVEVNDFSTNESKPNPADNIENEKDEIIFQETEKISDSKSIFQKVLTVISTSFIMAIDSFILSRDAFGKKYSNSNKAGEKKTGDKEKKNTSRKLIKTKDIINAIELTKKQQAAEERKIAKLKRLAKIRSLLTPSPVSEEEDLLNLDFITYDIEEPVTTDFVQTILSLSEFCKIERRWKKQKRIVFQKPKTFSPQRNFYFDEKTKNSLFSDFLIKSLDEALCIPPKYSAFYRKEFLKIIVTYHNTLCLKLKIEKHFSRVPFNSLDENYSDFLVNKDAIRDNYIVEMHTLCKQNNFNNDFMQDFSKTLYSEQASLYPLRARALLIKSNYLKTYNKELLKFWTSIKDKK